MFKIFKIFMLTTNRSFTLGTLDSMLFSLSGDQAPSLKLFTKSAKQTAETDNVKPLSEINK